MYWKLRGFPGNSAGKESACNAGDPGSIPGSGRSPGEGIGYALQYSWLENSMDRGAWWATVHGVAKSRTQLSNLHLVTRVSPWEPALYLCSARSQEYIHWSWFLLLKIPFPSRLLLISLSFPGSFPKVLALRCGPLGDSHTTLRTPVSTPRPRAPRVAHVVICLWERVDAQGHLIHHRSKAKLIIFLT